MAVSKVNLFTNEISYCPPEFNGATGQGRNTLLFEILKKILVIGGDVNDIESITVTDNVARVITVSKAFKSFPGCKVDIEGTGVGALDTKHEIQKVFTDGFEIDVETPDATFTNGLTFRASALGWSLLDQDANRLLLRSGSGAVTPFNILLERRQTSFAALMCICCYINYDATSLNDITSFFPLKHIRDYYFPSRYEGLAENRLNYYFAYGDDAVFYFGTSVNNVNNLYMTFMCLGEAKSYQGSIPPTFIAGRRNGSAIGASDYNSSAVASPFPTSFYSNSSLDSANTISFLSFDYCIKNSFNSIYSNTALALNGMTSGYFSGTRKGTIRDTLVNSYEILPTYILNEGYSKMGSIPGHYYLDFDVSLITAGVNYHSFKINIEGKNKNTVIFLSGSSGRIDAPSTPYYNYSMLDLTGPIR